MCVQTQAMKTLSEVMDFFVQLSGATATHPMKYNNLKQLGIDYDEYSRRIVKQQEGVCETQRERERGKEVEQKVGKGVRTESGGKELEQKSGGKEVDQKEGEGGRTESGGEE